MMFFSSFLVVDDFVSADEEAALVRESEPHLQRQVYQRDHWDEVKGQQARVHTCKFAAPVKLPLLGPDICTVQICTFGDAARLLTRADISR